MEWQIIFETKRANIDFINKTLEAYCGICILRTLDPKKALLKIITFECYLEILNNIKKSLYETENIEINILEISKWDGVV